MHLTTTFLFSHMLSYLVSSPAYPRAHLRLVAYSPAAMAGMWKIVLQIIEHGHPLAEHPVSEDVLPDEQAVHDWIAWHEGEGWAFVPDGYKARQRKSPMPSATARQHHADLRSVSMGVDRLESMNGPCIAVRGLSGGLL